MLNAKGTVKAKVLVPELVQAPAKPELAQVLAVDKRGDKPVAVQHKPVPHNKPVERDNNNDRHHRRDRGGDVRVRVRAHARLHSQPLMLAATPAANLAVLILPRFSCLPSKECIYVCVFVGRRLLNAKGTVEVPAPVWATEKPEPVLAADKRGDKPAEGRNKPAGHNKPAEGDNKADDNDVPAIPPATRDRAIYTRAHIRRMHSLPLMTAATPIAN